MVKESESVIQQTPKPKCQLLMYFSKKLDLPFEKGDKVNVKIEGTKVILEKV